MAFLKQKQKQSIFIEVSLKEKSFWVDLLLLFFFSFRISAQMSLKQKAERANEVIDNSADLQTLKNRVEQLADKLRPKPTPFTARSEIS